MARIDLNCDLGEGAGHDAELMPLISSANIACGAHAGDEATMLATVRLARRHGVAIGAHPGFADRAHFGRRELPVTPTEAHALVLAQVRLLQAVAGQDGVRVMHVKPHGALYNLAARDAALALAVARAVGEADARLILFGPPDSELVLAGEKCGLRVANEVFADRTYRPDGSLTPRSQPRALITDEHVAVAQVRRMVHEGRVRTTDGSDFVVRADTVCVHGDGPHPVQFARRLRDELRKAGITIKAPGA
ncbi:MAG TPA: 5-oxoprolinase subunit PxpA [Lacunisphaera sp.]|nr:5-oxoprolinase subunit PxpA [Lacunisphaera sp.]